MGNANSVMVRRPLRRIKIGKTIFRWEIILKWALN
jgi:hypothetical protein